MSREGFAPQPYTPPAAEQDFVELRRLARHKQLRPRETPTLGADLVGFFKQHVEKRQSKFGRIADVWAQLIPSTLLPHTCLESFHAGTLKVLVDSSSHLFELKTVLLAGLDKQILLACKSQGLRKITTKLGRWYEGDDCGRVKF
jgi:hypothetical protein